MSFKSRLNVELVPKTCFCTNVRSEVSSGEWDVYRRAAYKRAGHKCAICNKKGRLEAHEIFSYNDKTGVQKLEDILALCPLCHKCYHLGFAKVKGLYKEVREHLKSLNGWDDDTMDDYDAYVFSVWRSRSQHQWSLDLSKLKDLT